jgi:hypothetical protein
MKESKSVQIITDPIREAQKLTVSLQEAQKHMAPDPEH